MSKFIWKPWDKAQPKPPTDNTRPSLDEIVKNVVFNNREVDNRRVRGVISVDEEARQRAKLHLETVAQINAYIDSIVKKEKKQLKRIYGCPGCQKPNQSWHEKCWENEVDSYQAIKSNEVTGDEA